MFRDFRVNPSEYGLVWLEIRKIELFGQINPFYSSTNGNDAYTVCTFTMNIRQSKTSEQKCVLILCESTFFLECGRKRRLDLCSGYHSPSFSLPLSLVSCQTHKTIFLECFTQFFLYFFLGACLLTTRNTK